MEIHINLYFIFSIYFKTTISCSKYPKTDYTYSPLSRDRVELAPGQVAMPNMSRKSLAQFRMESPPGEGSDVPDRMPSIASWTATATRKRFTVRTINNLVNYYQICPNRS